MAYTWKTLNDAIAAANDTAAVIAIKTEIQVDMAANVRFTVDAIASVNVHLNQISVDNSYTKNFFHLNNGASIFASYVPLTAPDYSFKKYVALVSQASTAAPTASGFENSIGAAVYSRTGVGRYRLTLAGAFPAARTVILTGQDTLAQALAVTFEAAGDYIAINTDVYSADNVPAPTDDILTNFPFEVRVYNSIIS